jgi:hypothetical protein
MLAPSLAAAAAPKAAATPFSIVICTTEGLVTVALGDEAPHAPASHGEHDHCPACLRLDPAAALPPAEATLAVPAPAPQARAPLAATAAAPRAPPHARPDPTGPPPRA